MSRPEITSSRRELVKIRRAKAPASHDENFSDGVIQDTTLCTEKSKGNLQADDAVRRDRLW